MNLYWWTSGYNGKILLRKQLGEVRFEWDMDTSDAEVVHASGTFFMPVDEAWRHLLTMANAFQKSGHPYQTVIDNENGELAYSMKL